MTPFVGFQFEIPRGETNEDDGFGQCHAYVRAQRKAMVSNTLRLIVKLPKGQMRCQFGHAPLSIASVYPGKRIVLMKVQLDPGSHVSVEGWGMPFSNPGHESDSWLNHGTKIAAGMTLSDIVHQRTFYLVVGNTPHPDSLEILWNSSVEKIEPFRYPYGDDHSWNLDRYQDMADIMKGAQFNLALSYDDDISRMAAVTQSVIQDDLWVAQHAAKIFATKFRAYFIPHNVNSADSRRFYAIVPVSKEFREHYEPAWRRLTRKEGKVRLAFFDTFENLPVPDLQTANEWDKIAKGRCWNARILENPQTLSVLENHKVDEWELVLAVHAPSRLSAEDITNLLKMFDSRQTANGSLKDHNDAWNFVSLLMDPQLTDTERKVDAVWQLRSEARPFNPAVWGMLDPEDCPDEATRRAAQDQPTPAHVQSRMRVNSELLRGRGFYDSLASDAAAQALPGDPSAVLGAIPPDDHDEPPIQVPWALSTTDLRATDPIHRSALMEEIFATERQRVDKYLANAPLGTGVITAGPGFGKTSAASVVCLSIRSSQGPVYGSAPANKVVDNFAERLAQIDNRVTERRNAGMPVEGRVHRLMIFRGYAESLEIESIRNRLENPQPPNEETPDSVSKPEGPFRLRLSGAEKVLQILGSPAVRALQDDDSEALHALRDQWNSLSHLDPLFAVAQERLPWDDFKEDELNEDKSFQWLLLKVLEKADVVLTTPSWSSKGMYRWWKRNVARGFLVDEAASMHRSDFDTLCGNTMMPVVLAGDDMQLEPTVMSRNETDDEDSYLLRHPHDGAMSPLLFLKTMGWPILRLCIQLRMAEGMFDLIHNLVYPDLPFKYGPGCKIDLPKHQDGRKLEAYVKERFPAIRAASAGKFAPIFVNCQNTVSLRDPVTGSKRNIGQVKIALNFLADFVRTSGAKAADIVLITPYKANVAIIERLRNKDPEYSTLREMQPAATVDSFQGREGIIVAVVMGTTASPLGPGFTTDRNRLNVMLSRQVSGLVVFGDIHVMGKLAGKGSKRGKLPAKVWTVGEDGLQHAMNTGMLGSVHVDLFGAGRVVPVDYKKLGA